MAGFVVDAEDACVVIGQRYQLLDRIGHGSTATVYRALDYTLDREVALKLLHPGELDAAEHEAKILAQVAHRNVVTIHDSGEASGRRFLALELLDGLDLRTWLSDQPRSGADIVDRFIAAGRALSEVHRAGFVHCDFKPSNVIIGADGRVVLIDFGLARLIQGVEAGLERQPLRVAEGTLAYMAPERLAGHRDDPRGDQFGFCVALWEALAGSNPFVGADPLARYQSIARGPTDPGRLLDAGVSRTLIAGLERGLAFEPGDRFASLDPLLELLDTHRPKKAVGERGRGVGLVELELRPLSNRTEVGKRPLLMAIGIAATIAIGWGLAPEGLTVAPAFSNLDPTADAALTVLESAHRHAEAGQVDVALNDLMYAAQLIEDVEKGSESFCTFAHATPRLAEVFERQRAGNQARVAYAIAIRYAAYCSGLDAAELKLRQEAAHALTWVEGHKPKQSLPTPP